MQEISNDIFIKKLKIQKQELEQCQKEQNLSSCMLCSELLSCRTRLSYIEAVYKSMSKGKVGGFEF
jgi:hypothetical protein